jgi:predicted ferric reductase
MFQSIAERPKQLALYALMALACVPFAFWVVLPDNWTLSNVSLYIALLSGFIGTIVMLTQFFLGTRTLSGLVFADLPWTLRLHRNLGIYGSLLIFLHPVAMLLPYAQNVLYIFVPEHDLVFGRALR